MPSQPKSQSLQPTGELPTPNTASRWALFMVPKVHRGVTSDIFNEWKMGTFNMDPLRAYPPSLKSEVWRLWWHLLLPWQCWGQDTDSWGVKSLLFMNLCLLTRYLLSVQFHWTHNSRRCMSLYLLHLTEASPAPVYTKSYLKTLPSLSALWWASIISGFK